MWSDYVVNPGETYTYRVIPLYGKPDSIKKGKSVDVTITTESPDSGPHGIYFNRGAAGSQAYSRLFGKYRRSYLSTDFSGRLRATPFIKPTDVPNREAYKWLSRGCEEALGAFIEQATGPGNSIRAAI
jgi:hypothetical protein